MHGVTSRKHWLFFAFGFLASVLIFASVFMVSGLIGQPPRAGAQQQPPGFLPQDPNQPVSSMRYADQYFLHDHLAQTLKTSKALAAAHVSPHGTAPAAAIGAQSGGVIGGGAEVFNSDPYVFDQAGESYAIDPSTVPASGQLGIIGVVGFSDFRGFYLTGTNTTSGYAVSQTVSCTAGTCAHLMKDGWLPVVTDPLCTDGSLLEPNGDPSVVAVGGTFYYVSLAIPVYGSTTNCAMTNGDNGIIVSMSNSNLENPAVNCADALTSNNCWTSIVVHESTCSGGTGPCTSDDKPWITADPVSGNVTVAWDLLNYAASNPAVVDATTCNAALSSCSAATQVSVSAPACTSGPCDDTYAPYLAVWHNPSTGNNDVVLSYEQYDYTCPTTGPCTYTVDLHLADITAHTDQLFVSLPSYQYLTRLAQDQFFFQTQVKVAADYRNIANPQIYVTWDQCKYVSNPSDGTGDGASYFSGGYSGACAQSQVRADNFTSPTASPSAMPVQGGWDQFMPSIQVDEFGGDAGHVALAYYSTQGDSVTNALLRPYAAVSAGGTAGFNTSTYGALLTINDRPQADPEATYGYGGSGVMGDYLGLGIANGGVFVNFTGTYIQKSGPDYLGVVPVSQQDNYMCYIQPGTAYSSKSACASA